MSVQTDPYTFTNGTVADALEVNARISLLYTLQNGGIDAANVDLTDDYTWTGIHTLSAGKLLIGTSKVDEALAPIGSIIPFYDFDGDATFDTDYWVYCDGSAATLGGGIGAKTLPDLSNRYLVGFGTEGGGDIDSAAWATAAVGNASHQVDVSHTHTGPSHTHGAGTLKFQIASSDATKVYWYNSAGDSDYIAVTQSVHGTGSAPLAKWTWTNGESWYTGGASTGATGADGTGATSSELSATQSIQPRSVRVRYIMRIL